jgi:hypothetical protein
MHHQPGVRTVVSQRVEMAEVLLLSEQPDVPEPLIDV